MEMLVEIRNLNHYFGSGALSHQVLFDINLEVYAGEIIILMGPSGSGKTTLLSLIGGLRSLLEGNLTVLGQNLHNASEDRRIWVRRRIGYIFQEHNLLQFMTALQNVQMSVELHENISSREASAKSEAMLNAVGLGDRLHYYPKNLSGGQKQRVAIARALVNHPKLILADEPTAALDSKTGRDVVELMQGLAKQQGAAILIVTHDNRILHLADRIVRMEDGQILKQSHQVKHNSEQTSPC
ncbi:MAG TPA: ABC transporter [Cyanobacteria bacterium UBA11372]|nr:ABC transporter [Cyanobacteria bacterium UBA11372]